MVAARSVRCCRSDGRMMVVHVHSSSSAVRAFTTTNSSLRDKAYYLISAMSIMSLVAPWIFMCRSRWPRRPAA